MKNKLITIFAVIGAVAAIAGGVAYLLKVKKELDGNDDMYIGTPDIGIDVKDR